MSKQNYLTIIVLLAFAFIIPIALAVNLGFNIGVPEKVFYPNETIPINYTIENRDVQFKAKDATLTLTVGLRNYTYKIGDIPKDGVVFNTLDLPQYPPGNHVIRGVLKYEWLFDEVFTLETYKSITVRFPDIKNIPRGIKISSISVPSSITQYESGTITVVVGNDGNISGDLEIVVDSINATATKKIILEPGKSTSVSLDVQFDNAGNTLVEAKVFTTIEGQRFLLAYDGKIVPVTHSTKKLIVVREEDVNPKFEVCAQFECCTSSQCPSNFACDQKIHSCVPTHLIDVTKGLTIPKLPEPERPECTSDNQCSGGKICSPEIFKCVEKPECMPVIVNGHSDAKADIVFVGDGYFNENELKEDVLKLVDWGGNNGYHGLFSEFPFSSNKMKFNIWSVKAENKISRKSITFDGVPYQVPDRESSLKFASKCPQADYQIIISKNSYRSFAIGTDHYASIGSSVSCNAEPFTDYAPECDGRLILHEFGHSFGDLLDEYYGDQRIWDRDSGQVGPNCFATTSEEMCKQNSQWNSLVGKSENIGCFEGCTHYSKNVFRPTEDSIMKQQRFLNAKYYGVNERQILKKLERYE